MKNKMKNSTNGVDNLGFEKDQNDGEPKKSKSKEAKPEDPTVRELFKYSDRVDRILILFGIIFSFCAAGVYPLMFYMYGKIASTFVDLQKLDTIERLNNTNTTIDNPCFDLTEPDNLNFQKRIDDSIIFYIIFGAVSVLCNYVAYSCFETSAERQIKRIRNMLFGSLIKQEMGYFDRNSPGELNSKLTSNVSTLRLGMGFKISDFIVLAGRGLGCFIYAMISAWKFSIVFLGIMPFLAACVVLLIIFIKRFTLIELKAYGHAGKVAQEVLSSLRTVLAFGSMKKEVAKYEVNQREAEKMSTKKGLFAGFFIGLALMLFNFCFAIGLFYGVYLARTECDTYEPGDIMKSLFLMITATFSIGQGLPFLNDLSEARGSARAIFEIIDRKSEIDIDDKAGKIIPGTMSGDITFEDVHFSYPQRKEIKILNGLNLKIPAGKTVALCGASGGGKSTIIQLLQRFYDPTVGTIKIDGIEINRLDLEWLRSQMALVSQEPILFSTSIRENIRLGRLDATDEEVEEAAKCANAHNFIMSYPKNYDTQVGERGGQLSGGQKQRIAIARAILRNPKILLLDEATSALDYQSERIVQDALDKAKVGRTTIIIAHRLSTIRNADVIVGLGKGRLREIGTHEQLMNFKGIYYELVTSQTKESNKSGEELKQREIIIEPSALNVDRFKFEVGDETASKLNKDAEVQKMSEKKKETSVFELSLNMWHYHMPEILYIILGIVTQIIASIVNPLVSLIFTEIYTIFALPSAKEQEERSIKFMSIIFGIAVVNFFCTLSFHYSFALIGSRLTKRLRVLMFESLLKQEVAYHDLDENKSSILATKLAEAIPFCRGLTSDMLRLICQAVAGVGFSIIVGLIINWKLCLVIMAFIPVNFISGFINSQARTNKSKGKYDEEEGGRLAIEVVENIKTVISLGREKYFYKQFTEMFDKTYKKTLCLLHLRGVFYGISLSVLFFIQATAFSYGFYLIMNEGLKVTNLYRVYATITFTSMTLGRIFANMPEAKKARDACDMALTVINRRSKIDSMSTEGARPEKVFGNIEFKNVRFRYPNRPNLKILNGLNLNVKSGESNALVGESGCGKSTTIALLMRFYDIDSGSIELDGIDIRNLNIQWLRSKIGIVSQEPVLFDLTIRENISYGRIDDPNITMDEVLEVSKAANINDRIQGLPMKYETLVGTKGGQLSGGEKQRVAIARALLRSPPILLLDEATSALDNESEKVVQDALDKAQVGRTCIVIAHRLSTIQNSHKISVVKAGVVVEEGTHEELLELQGNYYQLQLQNSSNRTTN